MATTTSSSIVLTFPENLSSATRVSVSGMSSSGQSVIFANGLFVLFTQNGKIYTSDTGAQASWTQRTLPISTARINDVFYDGTRFVAVGSIIGSAPSRPTILHSIDAITWAEAATVPNGNELFTVLNADGLWIAGGSSRTLYTSGASSFSPPTVEPLPASLSGSTGGTITFTAVVGGSPAPTAFEWLRNSTPVANGTTASGSVISGADTASLTITGATLADAGSYFVRATNIVSTVNSTTTALTVSAASNGAVFTPYGFTNTLGGTVIPGSSPPKVIVGNRNATFSAAGGYYSLPNTFVNLTSYGHSGATNPSGTKILLGAFSGNVPLLAYDLATESGTLLPAVPLPIGPISTINLILPIGLAENGDATGIFQESNGQNHGFHYSAATQAYTLLGNVPNSGNDIASNPGGISADGTAISGYERTGPFNGPFLWTTTGGFTLLPEPQNGGFANGDIRAISPNGRFITGYGTSPNAFGSGQGAMRWDRGAGLGAPIGTSLVKTAADSFADGRSVNDDGTVGGNVRRGFGFNDNRAAVWLPNGALIVLPDYISSRYGLTTAGFTLNQVTSISQDRRVITGTATNPQNQSEGWLLTLPEPISITAPAPEIALRVGTGTPANGANFFFGSFQIGGGSYPTRSSFVGNLGTSDLTVSAAGITGPNAADFTISFAPPATQIPGTYGINEFTPFTIRFEPQPGAVGTRTAVLTIASDDPANPSYVVNLSATATAPPAQTPAQIALGNFLAAANVPENLRGPLDDPNGDGVNNLLAFALGLPPMVPTILPTATDEEGVLTLTYTRAQSANVTYTVKTSTDLGVTDPWSATGVDQGTPDGGGVTTATLPIDATPRFLRIEVNLIP